MLPVNTLLTISALAAYLQSMPGYCTYLFHIKNILPNSRLSGDMNKLEFVP